MAQNITVFVGGKKIDLNQSTYLAQGGQAVVHVKHGTAYKIYHDPAQMIPAGKIHALSKISLPNVLGPKEVILDAKGKEVGFTMPYIPDTEFLTRLFVSSFRTAANITPTMTKDLVKDMQLTMAALHNDYHVLVVDFNEMNELVAKDYVHSYFIDVDSYQIGSYPATALMDSVRDRKLKIDSQGRTLPGQFNENTDWFSFAVTACQTYLGCHPYKGRHPDFKPKDWMLMMDKNISVFNPKCRLPPNTQDLAVIPPAHRKWLEGVLEKGDRSAPPLPDGVVTQMTTPQVVFGTETFEITPIRKYDGKVLAVRFVQGICFAQTLNGFYMDDKRLDSVSVSDSGVKYDFCAVQGDNLPVRLTYRNAVKELQIDSLDKHIHETVRADSFFVANDRIYTVQNERIVEYLPSKMGSRTILGRQIVGNVIHNNLVGDGIVSQDILGKLWLQFPQRAGSSISMAVKELDPYRIIQIKRVKNVVIGIAQLGGRTDRFVLVFDEHFKTYNIRIEQDTDSLDANFVVLDKGVTVAVNDEKAELFLDNSNVKVVDKFPLTKGQMLVSFGNDVYFFHDKGIYKIALKKTP